MLISAGILTTFLGAPFKLAARVGLSAVQSFVLAGAQLVLREVVAIISSVTTPSLDSSWFSPIYWRIAGLALLLTVPFLFAAAIQAIVRGDPGVLLRSAFVDLPIATVAVSLAAPLMGLALAATDEMCQVVTGGGAGTSELLARTGLVLANTPGGFLVLVIAAVIVLAGIVLCVELILRSAAIYVVVLFLPLGFAAMVWPARRIWIKRMLELLISLILAKFAMVAILTLAVAGLTSFAVGASSLTTALAAMSMLMLAAGSPWALLRLLPFTEVAAGVGAMMHSEAARNLAPRDRSSGSGGPVPSPGALLAGLGPEAAGGAVLALGRQLGRGGGADTPGSRESVPGPDVGGDPDASEAGDAGASADSRRGGGSPVAPAPSGAAGTPAQTGWGTAPDGPEPGAIAPGVTRFASESRRPDPGQPALSQPGLNQPESSPFAREPGLAPAHPGPFAAEPGPAAPEPNPGTSELSLQDRHPFLRPDVADHQANLSGDGRDFFVPPPEDEPQGGRS